MRTTLLVLVTLIVSVSLAGADARLSVSPDPASTASDLRFASPGDLVAFWSQAPARPAGFSLRQSMVCGIM